MTSSPGIDQRRQREVDDGLAAGHDDHVVRTHVDAAVPGDVLGEDLAHLGQAGRRPVVGVAVAQGLDRLVDDVPRRVEVGLADLQVDDVPTLGLAGPWPGPAPRRRSRCPSLCIRLASMTLSPGMKFRAADRGNDTTVDRPAQVRESGREGVAAAGPESSKLGGKGRQVNRIRPARRGSARSPGPPPCGCRSGRWPGASDRSWRRTSRG